MLYSRRIKLNRTKMASIAKNHRTSNNNSREIREKLYRLLKTTRVRIFKNDPTSWIPQGHISIYKREISWQLYELTHLINMECWGIIVDILFENHSKVIFSLIYQLSNANYYRSTLPYLTSADESYTTVKKIASVLDENIVLYKPNYIPQYLKVDTHYINVITSMSGSSKETMLMYSQPIECLYSLDFHFQLGALTDLKFEETVRTFFDLSKCLIDIQDFDNDLIAATTGEEVDENEEQEQNRNMIMFKQRFDMDTAARRGAYYKAFVALWCESEDSKIIPDEWWPYLDNRSLTIEEFVLLLIKVSTSYSLTIIILYKEYYHCICGDSYQADLMVCEVHDDGLLDIPNGFKKKDIGTKYKRGSLMSLVNNNKSLLVN